MRCFDQDALLAKEEAKIQRKRELYEQRRVRILNAKVRLIGLDVQALNSQVEEKNRQREAEREEDRYASKIYSFQCLHKRLLTQTLHDHQELKHSKSSACWQLLKRKRDK